MLQHSGDACERWLGYAEQFQAQIEFTCLAVLYLALNVFLNLVNRWALGLLGIHAAFTLTAIHMVVGPVLVFLLDYCWGYGVVKTELPAAVKQIGWHVMTISGLNAFQIAINNYALQFCEVTMNQVLKGSAPLVVVTLNVICCCIAPTKWAFMLLIMNSFGIFIALSAPLVESLNDKSVDPLRCFSYTSAHVLLQSIQLLVTQIIMDQHSVGVFAMVLLTGPGSFLFLVPFAVALELSQIVEHASMFLLVAVSTSFGAVLYNLVYFKAIQKSGGIGLVVLANMKVVILLICSKFLFKEQSAWGSSEYVGCVLSLISSGLYSNMKQKSQKLSTHVASVVRILCVCIAFTVFTSLGVMQHWRAETRTTIVFQKNLSSIFDQISATFGVSNSFDIKQDILTENKSRSLVDHIITRSPYGRDDPNADDKYHFRSVSSNYSSFQCTGGSQDFQGWKLQHLPASFPTADDIRFRVCILHDVCWIKKELHYFESPSEQLLPHRFKMAGLASQNVKPAPQHDYLGGGSSQFVVPGYLGGSLALRVAQASVPRDVGYDLRSNIHLFDAHSWSDNIGHLLFDNLMPQFIALEMFDLAMHWSSSQLSVLTDCHLPLPVNNPYWNKPRKSVCMDLYTLFATLLFGSEPRWLLKSDDICFRNVIVGQSSAFSLYSMQISRSSSVRSFRDHVLFRLGLQGLAPGLPEIVIPLKTPGLNEKDSRWKDLCSYVGAVVRRADSERQLPVVCYVPVDVSFQDSVKIAQNAVIFVAEQGTISYNGIWCRDGTLLVSIADKRGMKEAHTLLSMTHVKTLFVSYDNPKDLDFVLLSTLQKLEPLSNRSMTVSNHSLSGVTVSNLSLSG